VKATSLGKTSIYNHISAGRLHAVRVGGRRLILAKSLEAFLNGEA
jgi:excisionase family DNA binding protein